MSFWTSVDDALPPEEVDVLCARQFQPPIVAGWFEDGFYTFDQDSDRVKHITHWMPLPTGPRRA